MEYLGALLVDKPAGITSHDVVAKLRRALKMKRIGHTGTLDPFATGLLIVCLGRATRLAQYLTGETKAYEATVRLGFSTDTQDYTGKPITPLTSSDEVTVTDLRGVVSEFIGEQLQLPPMFSAKKVAGEALYKHARRGETIERQAVKIEIYQAELISTDGAELLRNPDGTCDFGLRVVCSAGTYIRTLAHDLGERLGCGAHLTQLRRVAIGSFNIANAQPLDRLIEMAATTEIANQLVAPADLVEQWTAVTLDDAQIGRVAVGQAITAPAATKLTSRVRLLDCSGKLIAIAEVIESTDVQQLQPRILMIN